MGNTLQVFNNPEFGGIRAVEIDGEPWLVGKDVALALGYKDTINALKAHIDSEDKKGWRITTPSGEQTMIVINESGLYSLILSSKLPSAKQFKRWVTSEVLPSIRKHGAYITPVTIDSIIADPGSFLRLVAELQKEQEERKALESELDRSKEWYSIKRVAAMNNKPWKAYNWRDLKRKSQEMGVGVKKIFDANYGEVNTYHEKVWEVVYPDAEL